jgi:FKBP-type peptidyl-prolyl cis-trans isomerase
MQTRYVAAIAACGSMMFFCGCGREAAPPAPTAPAASAPAAAAGSKVVKLPSGTEYEDVVVGTGAEAKAGSTVFVHYTGTLKDGTKFDSSRDRGEPLPFQLGAGNVIKGWDQGIEGMKVGGKRKLTIPPDQAYGERSPSPKIPPNSTLLFETELMDVK